MPASWAPKALSLLPRLSDRPSQSSQIGDETAPTKSTQDIAPRSGRTFGRGSGATRKKFLRPVRTPGVLRQVCCLAAPFTKSSPPLRIAAKQSEQTNRMLTAGWALYRGDPASTSDGAWVKSRELFPKYDPTYRSWSLALRPMT